MSSVRLLLDVDGVLNAVTSSPGRHWEQWNNDLASPEGQNFRIRHAGEVGRFIRELHQAGVEIIWLSTWGKWANEWISPMLGLCELPVAGECQDYHDGGWWKLPLARGLWEKDHKPFVWLDDDLAYEREAQQWLSFLPERSHLAIAPETDKGIMAGHIIEIWDFVNQRQGSSNVY